MSHKTKPALVPSNADYDLGPVLISGVEPPSEGDTESDGALGARHVEHNLEVLLLAFQGNVIDTEIYLIWNNPNAPVDYIVIQPENLGNRFFSLMVDKEQILPEWAEVYCLIKRPSGNTSKTKPLKFRVKRNRPADPDPNPDADGNQGLVFFLPPDLEAGSHVDMNRAERGVLLEVQPWENMSEWDRCRIAWGTEIVEHVVKASEVQRSFEMLISPDIIKNNPHYVNMPVAMQIRDVAGNLPADPNSSSNWSEIKRVEVDLGLLRPRPPFLQQAGEIVDIDKLGGAAQIAQIFIDNDFFEKDDSIKFLWEGRDIQNAPFFHEEQRDVTLTNFIEDFEIPNELVTAIASGTSIMYYLLYKRRDNEWLPSRKVRIRVIGDVPQWAAPSILEAPSGELPPDSQATIEFFAQDGWTSATQIRIVLVAHSVNFIYEFYLGPIPDDRKFTFTVSGDEISRFNTLTVEVYYERIDLMPSRQSQRFSLHVGEVTRVLLPVEIEKAWGNYLITEIIDDTLLVSVPLTDSLEKDKIILDWYGDFVSTTVELEVGAGQAGQTVYAVIDKSFVTENLNGSVRVKYRLVRTGSPIRFAQIRTYHVRAEFDHITTFDNADINGWRYGPALNDLRDRLFRIRTTPTTFTVFLNYTYTEMSDGVLFLQEFRNLRPGGRYEFSIKARRYQGAYAVPMLSLSSSQGGVAGPTTISDLVSFHTLIGTITATSDAITLYVNSEVSTGIGNDYEISEMRFRLL